jgi:benzoate/toluate 1,2-dioxygenase alpha subunit
MGRYRDNPQTLAALVEPDRVHRDVYIDPEVFELEMEQLWANTWIYVGHDSQVPNAGDYFTTDIAGKPVVMVRHEDGSVRVLMNRCAHKGARVVSAVSGNTGKFFRCPYHAWAYNTDGSIRAIPLKSGYDGTRMSECETGRGMVAVRNVETYRGFVFARLSERGPGFREYFGDSLSSIDNMADRSPAGELEIAGGVLRYLHNCNWKMFVENLNDTMHPMVAHESSAGTAKKLWEGKPADLPKPMAIEQFVPFASDHKFFDDMGVRVFENGHSYTGVNFSIHSNYSAIPGYEDMMVQAYGDARAREILATARHNTVYYPSLTIKGAIQAIRVARPIAADKTVIESWTFRLKHAPDKLLQRTVMYTRLINSPMSVVGHDDLHAYRSIQEGLHATGNEWISMHRNYRPEEADAKDLVVNGTSEISMRNQFRAWARYMTLNMEPVHR